MVDKSKGKRYELLIFTLLLLRSKEYDCDIGKEVEVTDKFDDCVVKYKQGEKTKWICCQAKLVDNGNKKILNEKVLLGKEKISFNIKDFDLKKYFLSFLKIRQAFNGTENALEKLIIYSNVSDIEDNLKNEKNDEIDDIRGIFKSNSSKIFTLKIDASKNITKELMGATMGQNLVKHLNEYCNPKHMSDQNTALRMESRNEIYRYALFNENVLELEETNSSVNHNYCKFSRKFIEGTDLSEGAKKLREELKIGTSFEKDNLLMEQKWQCDKDFHEYKESLPKNLSDWPMVCKGLMFENLVNALRIYTNLKIEESVLPIMKKDDKAYKNYRFVLFEENVLQLEPMNDSSAMSCKFSKKFIFDQDLSESAKQLRKSLNIDMIEDKELLIQLTWRCEADFYDEHRVDLQSKLPESVIEDTQELKRKNTMFQKLVKHLKPYTVLRKPPNLPIVKKYDEVYEFYSALFKENVLTLRDGVSNSKYNHCSFNEKFLNGDELSEKATKLRDRLKIDSIENKNKLLQLEWKYEKNVFEEKIRSNLHVELPEFEQIMKEDVDDFLSLLEFHIGQPDLFLLEEEIKRKAYELFPHNFLNIENILQSHIKNWRDQKVQKEDWIENSQKDEFFQGLSKNIENLQIESVSNENKSKIHFIINKFKIQCSREICGIEQYMKNEETVCFVETEQKSLTSIKILQVVEKDKSLKSLFIKNENISKQFIEKVIELQRKAVYDVIIAECKNKIPEDIENLIQTIQSTRQKIILYGKISEYPNSAIKLRDTDLINIEDLKNEEELRKTKIVWQGNTIELREVQLKLFDFEFIKKVLFNETISIGNGLIFSKSNTKVQKYIPRILKYPILEANILQINKQNNEDVLVIIDDENRITDIKTSAVIEKTTAKCALQKFEKICEKEKGSARNVHLLEYTKEKQLLWKRTRGSIRNIHQYLTSTIISEEKLSDKLQDNRFCVICGVSGMGKTTLVDNICQQFTNGYNIVVRFNLNEYKHVFDDFKQIANVENAMDLLCTMLDDKIREETFEKKFAKLSLKETQKKVIILFDAFDEIYLDYSELVLDLFKCLKFSDISKIIITTRPNFLDILENHLSVLSINIGQFHDNDQKSFLKNIFESKLNTISNKLDVYVDSILSLLNKSIDDEIKSFTGIPLILILISQVFAISKENNLNFQTCDEFLKSNDEQPKLPEKLNLLYLYEQFIKNFYFQWHFEEKFEIKINKQIERQFQIQSNYEQFVENCKKCALLLFFKVQELKIFSIEENLLENIKSQFSTSTEGLIIRINNGVPQFLHESIAEYLVSTFLIKNIYESSQKRIQYFVKKILTNDLYQNIRVFLNLYLHTDRKYRKSFQKIIKFYDRKIVKRILRQATIDDNKEFLLLTFEILKEKQIDLKSFIKTLTYEHEDSIIHLVLNKRCSISTIEIILRNCNLMIDSVNSSGETPLHYAVKQNKAKVVKLLVNFKPNCDVQDKLFKRTPLHYACELNNEKIVKHLVDLNPNCDLQDKDSKTPLHYGVEHKNVEIVKFLLNLSPNCDIQDYYGATPFHYAIEGKNERIVELFLKSKPNCGVQDKEGKSPVHYAVQQMKENIVELLLTLDPDCDIQDKYNKQTPLHYAVVQGNDEIVKLLLEKKANCDIRDKDGKTPLDHAIQQKNHTIIEIFNEKLLK